MSTTIRINKSTDPSSWYANLVGQTIPYDRFEANKRPDQGLPEDVYWCREGGVYNARNFVRASDATEVTPSPDQRARFEQWAKSHRERINRTGEYYVRDEEYAFAAWQAALAPHVPAPTSGKEGTPLTEEAITSFNDQCDVPVSASFARRLERDLTSARAEIARLTPLQYGPLLTENEALTKELISLRADLTAARAELGKLGADYRELRDDSADIAKDNITLREEVERLKVFFSDGRVNWDALNSTIDRVNKLAEQQRTENITLRATSEAMAGAMIGALEQKIKDYDFYGQEQICASIVSKELKLLLSAIRAATPALLQQERPPVGSFVIIHNGTDRVKVEAHTERGFKYSGGLGISIPRMGIHGTGDGEVFLDVPHSGAQWEHDATPAQPDQLKKETNL